MPQRGANKLNARAGATLHFIHMDNVDVVVIGAGVVGLAVARALATRRREVLILEAADHFGTGISSRNSEVITRASTIRAARSGPGCASPVATCSTISASSTGFP